MKDHTLGRKRTTSVGMTKDFGYAEEQNICCIPHCQRNRADQVSIHLCEHHIQKAWAAYQVLHGAAAHEAADPDRDVTSPDAKGTIYVVRVQNLIKVGWTSNLPRRLIDLHADAVLHHYAGTRQDEADLHRHLKPHLAKGREWYTPSSELDKIIEQLRIVHPPTAATAPIR